MKKKHSIFQWIILGFFFFLALIGFVLFSNYRGSTNKEEIKVGSVVIWGTVDKQIVDRLLVNLRNENSAYKDVVYQEKNKNNYREDILEALASGESPDLIILSNENIFSNLNKIQPISYQWFNKRDYINTYADAFEIFLGKDGILAIPFLIDPMVMYYNKSIFKTVAIPSPPKYWQEFFNLSEKITLLDEQENIKRATISFGESINVNNLKEIIATLILQLENKIVIKNDEGRLVADIWKTKEGNPVPGLLFFAEFSNQTSSVYSWNRSMPNSLDYFLSGRLATYFGFASETPKIRFKNPNLNFDVAEIPGIKKMDNKTVFAKVWGLAIPKSPQVNVSGAFIVAMALSDKPTQELLAQELKLPPIRKSLLAQRPEDSFMDIFYKGAIYANTFIDPNWKETEKIFKFMVQSITGGREHPQEAVKTAFEEIGILLKNR